MLLSHLSAPALTMEHGTGTDNYLESEEREITERVYCNIAVTTLP